LLALVAVFALPAEARRNPARLVLQSATTGAEVYIDGEKVGEVPLDGPIRLRPGKHTLKISLPGYTQYLDVFSARRGKTTRLEIDLLPVAGVLEVRSNVPESSVLIDGKFVGTTPLGTEVLPGKRMLVVRKAGHHDFVETIQAVAGQTIRAQAELTPLPVESRVPAVTTASPAPRPQWYKRWYVWAAVAGGAAAVALAIAIPVAAGGGDAVDDFAPEYRWQAQ
jgi:hypothetical protein